MYLFSRRRRINPAHARAALGVAVQVTGLVKDTTGQDVRAWSAVLSPELGTIAWSVRVEHLEELEVAADKLANSNQFMDLVEQNDAMFIGPAEDSLLEVVHGAFSDQVPEYVNTTRAECAPGAITRAMAIGVEIAEAATRITGLPTIFARSLTGRYGEAAWISGAPDLSTMERNNAKLTTDASWLPLIDRAGSAFLPGATTTLLRRLA